MDMQQSTETSQTASDYISTQLRLEADAREILPYQFDSCTKQLGPLRQSIFACLTCTPAPASASQQFSPAGVCYSCSISCHGEHDLVELFSKRDFVCDCGTTRYGNSQAPCSLRLNTTTGRKGGVVNEEPREGNKYNHNFAGRFCACGDAYDPEKEKGTMFQCLGLGTVDDGGCGEDWWHPECIMGLTRVKELDPRTGQTTSSSKLSPVKEDAIPDNAPEQEQPLPEGFPEEDDFDHFICYKCTQAFPWIKQYTGATGFLPAVSFEAASTSNGERAVPTSDIDGDVQEAAPASRKRKADDEVNQIGEHKKPKNEVEGEDEAADGHGLDMAPATTSEGPTALHERLPSPPSGKVSLFLKEDFRDHFCRCSECFPRLARHPQLLEEEDPYEPPLSESDAPNEHQSAAGRSVNSGSLLERGEAALSSMDRVRAIEGVMAYNHVRDKVKEFLAPFAESGKAVGAEDIKAYFAQLRGDEQTPQTD